MAGKTNPRKLEQFAEHRARGKSVVEAAKLMKVSERTGWRWNAQIGLRDHNPEPEPVKRAGKVLGVPPDPDPPTWAEEVQEAKVEVAEVETEPVSEPVLPFPADGTVDQKWGWLRENNPAPSRENAGSGANPVVTRAGEGMTFPDSSNVGWVPNRQFDEESHGYRTASAKRIHGITGKELPGPPGLRQKADPRFDVNRNRKRSRFARGYWLNGSS